MRFALASLILVWGQVASAQTADEVMARSVTAMGGRPALEKLKSRTSTGTITLSTPGGDIVGSVELYNAAPNKSRSVIKADLSQFGAGQLVMDQRFNGTSGYVLDSLQGDREMASDQLNNLRNASFPHPFLSYKEMGVTAQLAGKAKVGDRDAHIVTLEPPTGPVVRVFVDAETFLPLQMSLKVNVPQVGGEIEQTTVLLDYREIDGIKLPYKLEASSSVQNYTITITTVEHNVPIDEALFSKPAK